MQRVLIIVAATLLSCQGSSLGRHVGLMADVGNGIDADVLLPKHRNKKFVMMTAHPEAATPFHPGSVLELTCEAISRPAPSVRWFRNDAPVFEHDLESNEVVDASPTSVARITSTILVPRVDGAEEYTCVITAGAKTTKATTTVFNAGGSTDLSERSKLTPLAPRILVSYKVFVDTIGTNVVLPCRAKGHPKPHITWKDNLGAVVKRNPRMQVLRSGELIISSLLWSDMGEYTCLAENAYGSQVISTFVYPARSV